MAVTGLGSFFKVNESLTEYAFCEGCGVTTNDKILALGSKFSIDLDNPSSIRSVVVGSIGSKSKPLNDPQKWIEFFLSLCGENNVLITKNSLSLEN